jgi:hypothetical protein
MSAVSKNLPGAGPVVFLLAMITEGALRDLNRYSLMPLHLEADGEAKNITQNYRQRPEKGDLYRQQNS